jgi:hypothetical protein
MAKKGTTSVTPPATANDAIEQGVVAFAEQLGTLVGTVQAKTSGWLDRESLGKELTRIRDGAAQLLDQVSPAALTRGKAAPKRAKKAPLPSQRRRGPVDAPRQAAPQAPSTSEGWQACERAEGARDRKPWAEDRAARRTRVTF